MLRMRRVLEALKSAGFSNQWTTGLSLGVMLLYMASRFQWVPSNIVDEIMLMAIVALGFLAKDGTK